MKFQIEIVIDLPRQQVIELFDNPDNLPAWQPGLEKVELISGEPGQPGARSRLVFRRDQREIEMFATVTARYLGLNEHNQGGFSGTYETAGVKNRVSNRFYDLGAGRTRWVTVNKFKFRGWMRLLAIFLGSAFRKQTLDDMKRFKAFAEGVST